MKGENHISIEFSSSRIKSKAKIIFGGKDNKEWFIRPLNADREGIDSVYRGSSASERMQSMINEIKARNGINVFVRLRPENYTSYILN